MASSVVGTHVGKSVSRASQYFAARGLKPLSVERAACESRASTRALRSWRPETIFGIGLYSLIILMASSGKADAITSVAVLAFAISCARRSCRCFLSTGIPDFLIGLFSIYSRNKYNRFLFAGPVSFSIAIDLGPEPMKTLFEDDVAHVWHPSMPRGNMASWPNWSKPTENKVHGFSTTRSVVFTLRSVSKRISFSDEK